MHNIKDLRNNLEIYKKKFKDRNLDFDVKDFEQKDKINRELINKKELLEQEKKALSKSKEKSNFEKSKKLSNEIEKTQRDINQIIFNLPNIATEDVPVSKDQKGNKLIRKFGNIKKFDFKLKSHVELGQKNKGIDFDTSTKLSGSRFVLLRDNFAKLERALINFMLDIHVNQFKYIEISPPLIVNEDVMFGTGQLPKFEEDQFELKLNNSDERKFLIPTAEVVLTNILLSQTIVKMN